MTQHDSTVLFIDITAELYAVLRVKFHRLSFMMDDGLEVIVWRDDDSARVKAPSVLLDCRGSSHLVLADLFCW